MWLCVLFARMWLCAVFFCFDFYWILDWASKYIERLNMHSVLVSHSRSYWAATAGTSARHMRKFWVLFVCVFFLCRYCWCSRAARSLTAHSVWVSWCVFVYVDLPNDLDCCSDASEHYYRVLTSHFVYTYLILSFHTYAHQWNNTVVVILFFVCSIFSSVTFSVHFFCIYILLCTEYRHTYLSFCANNNNNNNHRVKEKPKLNEEGNFG